MLKFPRLCLGFHVSSVLQVHVNVSKFLMCSKFLFRFSSFQCAPSSSCSSFQGHVQVSRYFVCLEFLFKFSIF
jgi:hypothetical protein